VARTRSGGSIALIVIGALCALFGLAALGGGGGLLVLNAVTDDRDGFMTTGEVTLGTQTHALVSENMDMWSEAGPDDWTPRFGDVAIRVTATPTGERPLFLGIGPTDEVDAYLDGVGHEVVSNIQPGRVTTRTITGEATPVPPGEVDLWAEQETGPGTQTLTWDLTAGNWTLVVMHADGSPGVEVIATGGVRVPFLPAIGIALLVLAVILIAVAVALLVAGASSGRETGTGATPPGGVPPTGTSTAPSPRGPYPVAVTASLDPGLSRWQWLVKWFLAIPHLVVLAFLWVAFVLLTVVAGFSILFTRRYPRGIFDFNVGVMRWTWRVTYYAFGVLGTDAYPPFTLARTDYPADFDVAYPEEGLSRGLVLVKWWLLAIPHYIIVAILTGGIVSWTADIGRPDGWDLTVGGGLIGILTFVAVVVLLFRGRYPQSLFDLTVGLQRWVYRVGAYAGLMTDDYPPFRLDTGGQEPPVPTERPEGGPPPSGAAAPPPTPATSA
jgi:hypothetical protein